MLKMDVAGLFARDDGPNACQMAYEMQTYFFIGKPDSLCLHGLITPKYFSKTW